VMALSTLFSSEFVNPAMADTTINGCELTANFTIAATFRKALASSTDVPPNFMIDDFIFLA
jgi:hypothetical protein